MESRLTLQTICETSDFQTAMIQKGIDHGHDIAFIVLENYPAPPPSVTHP